MTTYSFGLIIYSYYPICCMVNFRPTANPLNMFYISMPNFWPWTEPSTAFKCRNVIVFWDCPVSRKNFRHRRSCTQTGKPDLYDAAEIPRISSERRYRAEVAQGLVQSQSSCALFSSDWVLSDTFYFLR